GRQDDHPPRRVQPGRLDEVEVPLPGKCNVRHQADQSVQDPRDDRRRPADEEGDEGKLDDADAGTKISLVKGVALPLLIDAQEQPDGRDHGLPSVLVTCVMSPCGSVESTDSPGPAQVATSARACRQGLRDNGRSIRCHPAPSTHRAATRRAPCKTLSGFATPSASAASHTRSPASRNWASSTISSACPTR